MMLPKHQLLEILSGTICPICGHEKPAHVWTCGWCGRSHEGTPLHRALSQSCDAHMVAAAAFLDMARTTVQKPESD